MSTVGIEELQEHAEALLRRVAESGEPIEIVYHGRVAARLVPPVSPAPEYWEVPAQRSPIDPTPSRLEPGKHSNHADPDTRHAEIWAELARLGEEIGKSWPDGLTAVDAVREQRRY